MVNNSLENLKFGNDTLTGNGSFVIPNTSEYNYGIAICSDNNNVNVMRVFNNGSNMVIYCRNYDGTNMTDTITRKFNYVLWK